MFLFTSNAHKKEVFKVFTEFRLGIFYLCFLILVSSTSHGREQMRGLVFYFILSMTIILMGKDAEDKKIR